MTGVVTPDPDPTVLTTESLLREIGHLKELLNLRFELIERQRLESKEDNQKALDAALSAAQDSVASLALTSTLGRDVLTKAVDDLKNRVVAVESKALGANENRVESRDTRADSQARLALWISGVNALILVAMTVVNQISAHMGH